MKLIKFNELNEIRCKNELLSKGVTQAQMSGYYYIKTLFRHKEVKTMNNNPIALALKPIQGFLLGFVLGVKPLVTGAIPADRKKSVFSFIGILRLLLASTLLLPRQGGIIPDPDNKKDCYFLNLLGIPHIHNSDSKSQPVKKRILIKNRVSYKF